MGGEAEEPIAFFILNTVFLIVYHLLTIHTSFNVQNYENKENEHKTIMRKLCFPYSSSWFLQKFYECKYSCYSMYKIKATFIILHSPWLYSPKYKVNEKLTRWTKQELRFLQVGIQFIGEGSLCSCRWTIYSSICWL